MKFEAPNGETLSIAFRYRTHGKNGHYKDGKTHLDNRKRVETFCMISRFHPDKTGRERFETLGAGHTVRNPHDPFDKGHGRRIALTRAMQDLPEEIQMNKAQRLTRVWNVYFRDHNDRRCEEKQGQKRVGPGAQVAIATT